MKMRLTVIYEYTTGNDDKTMADYGTLDPSECLALDGKNISNMGGVNEIVSETDIQSDNWVLEIVPATEVSTTSTRGQGTMKSSRVADAPSQAYERRLSVNVALNVGEAICDLAFRHGTSITDIIRRAVSTYKYIDDETIGGARILVERNRTVREVKFY